MTHAHRRRPAWPAARGLALALSFALAGTVRPVRAAADFPHSLKLEYARRLAAEGARERAERLERLARARQLARLPRRPGQTRAHAIARPRAAGGERLRPDVSRDGGPAAPAGRRAAPAALSTVPTNYLVNNRAGDASDAGQSEESVAAFGSIMVAAWNDGQGFNLPSGDTQGWGYSTNGGQTWTDGGIPPKPSSGVTGFQWVSDPVVTLNEKTGAFYYSALCSFTDGSGFESGVAVAKGRWNGSAFAWSNVSVAFRTLATNALLDKEWVVADSSSGRVYLAYTDYFNLSSNLNRIEVVAADSSLSAWTTPRVVSVQNTVEQGFVQAARPVVTGDGTLYAMYYLIGQNEADYYKFARSTDGGLSFSTAVVAESLYTNFGTGAPGFNRDFGIQFASVAVDRSQGPHRGRLYLSWAESINWLDDVANIGKSGNKGEIEPNDSAAVATAIVAGQTLHGVLTSTSDFDYYAVPLVAGQHLIAYADSISASLQMTLRLFATDGRTRLAFSDNQNGLVPIWMFTAPASGTYYLRVAAFSGSGGYRIRTGFGVRGLERGRDQRDAFVAHSDDGAAWSSPVMVNDDAVGFDNWLPEVATAPDGGVYCAWFDFRDSQPATNGGEAGVHLAYSADGGDTWNPLGQVSSVLTNWTNVATNIQPNQGDYLAVYASDQSVWTCWADGRNGDPDVYIAAQPVIAVGTQVAVVSVGVTPTHVDLAWQATPADTLTALLYRSVDGGAYAYVTLLQAPASGQLSYRDSLVTPGHVYRYRLQISSAGTPLFVGQATVFVPGPELALGRPWPNPVTGPSFTLPLTLSGAGPLRVRILDVSGRQAWSQTWTGLAGQQQLVISPSPRLRQGLYILKVEEGGRDRTTRIAVVR